MNKCMLIIYFSLIVFLICSSGKAKALDDLEVVTCDGCSVSQYRNKVINATTINNRVIVLDVLNRKIVAYFRNVESEPGFQGVYVWSSTVPYEYQASFDDYMQIYDLIKNTHATTKVWNNIPKQLSSQGVQNASATLQGNPFPIRRQICTNICVETGSVHHVFNNLDAQRLIGLELNRAYLATINMRFKVVLRKYFTSRPFIITVKFSDDTKVDFMLVNPEFTIPWNILPDTALDSQGKPIAPPSNTRHQFSGGYGEGNYRADRNFNDGFTLKQQCRTVFTGSSGNMVSQVVCWLIP